MSAAPELLVIGSLNTDLLVRIGVLPGPGETVTGGVVAMVGAVGADEFGARLLEELAAEGVSVAGMARLSGVATGLAAIVVDEEGENQIAVASGANHALRARDVERAFGELDLSQARCALLSLEVDDEVVVEGAERAAAGGMAVVVNPAPARPLPPELVAHRPIVTPNQGEAAELTGHEDPAAAAAAMVESGAAAALVTVGERGVVVADGIRVERFEAPPVSVRDTTGAGDTFSGVLAAGLARGWELDRATRWATAAAALSVTKSGARGGMPVAGEIEAVAAS